MSGKILTDQQFNLDRRRLLSAMLMATASGPVWAGVPERRPKMRIVAEGLLAPESPKPLADGSVLLVEMARGTLSRVQPSGAISVVADLGGSPNGCALGPDGAVYVVNNGGARFERRGGLLCWAGHDPHGIAKVQRVDLETGAFSTLYAATAAAPLCAPNDLVFDNYGGFYFSDTAAPTSTGEAGAIYWAKADGSAIKRLASVPGANGIALSPDHTRLYVASNQQIVVFKIASPGNIESNSDELPAGRLFSQIEQGQFDSMAIEADGGLVVATLITGGLTVFSANGGLREVIQFPPEKYVTNVGFGGPDLRTAYVTLGQTCKLISVEWPRSGLRLANQ